MKLNRHSIAAGITVLGLALSASPAMARGGGDGGGDTQSAGTVSFSTLPTTTTTTTSGGSNSGGSGGGGKTTVFSCAWTIDPVTGFLTATVCGPKQGV